MGEKIPAPAAAWRRQGRHGRPPRRGARLSGTRPCGARLSGALLALALLAWAPGPGTGAVTFQQQAQRLQQVYAYLLDYRPGLAPLPMPGVGWEISLDLTPLPAIDNTVGGKDEPVAPPPAIPRPRARYFGASGGLGAGFTLTPPVAVQGYTAALVGGEVFYHFAIGRVGVGLRAFMMTGAVDGPITDPVATDRFSLTNSGADLRLGWNAGGWMPYLGYGSGNSASVLNVTSDGARLDSDAPYSYLLAGATWVGESFRFTVEQSATENFLRHFIVAISYSL